MQLKMRADFQQNTKTVAKADRQSDKKSWVPEKKRGTKTIKKCCFCNRDVDHVDVRLACNWIALNTKSHLEKKERTMGNNDARQQLSRQNLSQAEVVSSERIKNTSNLEISIFFHFPPFFSASLYCCTWFQEVRDLSCNFSFRSAALDLLWCVAREFCWLWSQDSTV